MSGENSDGGGKEILVVLGIVGLVLLVIGLIYLLTIIAVLAVIAATGASVFYGVKLAWQVAMNSEVWENRRIAKSRRLRAQWEKEKAYFERQGMEQMSALVDSHYEDKERELYKEKHTLDDTFNTVKKLKEAFKK